MLKKFAFVVLLAAMFAGASSIAQVAIRIGPPPPVVEHYGPPPRPGYVWRGGYHRWNGRSYVWVPGGYVLPPRPHAVWVPRRYYRRGPRWHYRRGYWR